MRMAEEQVRIDATPEAVWAVLTQKPRPKLCDRWMKLWPRWKLRAFNRRRDRAARSGSGVNSADIGDRVAGAIITAQA